MKKLSMYSLALLLMLSITGCGNKVGTSPQGKEAPIEKAALKLVSDVKTGGYDLVSTENLKKMIDENRVMTIISTSPKANYVKAHISGSVNAVIPKTEKEMTPDYKANLLKIAGDNKNRIIVTYCGYVACRRSHIAARILAENGFKNVYRYSGGIVTWKENKLPLN